MRFRFVVRQLGLLLALLSAAMLLPAAWSLYDRLVHGLPGAREATLALLLSAGIGAAIGLLMAWASRPQDRHLGRREALLLVALTYVIGAALAALPFRLWTVLAGSIPEAPQPFDSFVNCYFEAMSGLTTTGSSILSDIEAVPRGLLFWRAFTQWIGGLGIVVLFVAVLPILGVGGKRLYRFEAPGPTKEGVRPRIRAAAQVLWMIYVGLSLIQILALRFAGMGWFDAVTHTFTTLASGGYSTQNASIAAFASARIEWILIVFMFLAGVNFSLYDRLISGHWRAVLRDPELRAYVLILLGATVLVIVLTHGVPVILVDGSVEHGTWAAWRHVLFTVTSIQTTTGYGTADFDHWPMLAQGILLTLMYVGGCAGSTAGGIKVIRFIVLAKVLWAQLETIYRPNLVRTVRVGRTVIDPQLRYATLMHFILFGVILVAATGVTMIIEADNVERQGGDVSVTAFAAVAATLNVIGPGLDLVGPAGNFGFFSDVTKLILSLLMALGRVELYAFLVLFMPSFWREE